MTVAQCPKCREQVSIPTAASRRARVRCPLCCEEYLLDDALKALPPLLVVVDDPESESSEVLLKPSHVVPATSDADDASEIPALVSDEPPEEFNFQREAPAAAPAFNFESGSAVSMARPTSVAARPRARRKESGPIRMAIQTVGGGLMGLIIAQLILWWMPGGWANENRDPAGLAKKVAKYVPAIVPASLREDVPTAHASQPRNPPATNPPRMQSSGRYGQGPGTEDEATQKRPDIDSDAANNQLPKSERKRKKDDQKEPADNPNDFPLAGLNEPSSSEKQPPQEPNSNPPTTSVEVSKPVTKSDDATKQGQPPQPSVTATPIKDDAAKDTADTAAAMKTAEIKAHLNEVARAEKAWDTADNPSIEKKRELIIDLYVQLAQLGSTIAQAGARRPASAESLRPVIEKLNTLAGRADKLVPLGRLAAMRLQEDRDKGAILVGVVLSHQTRGKVHETQLRLLAKSDPVVTVVSPVDLAKELPANANIIVLGRWISNPADNLAGYEGKEDSVLLHGTHVVVPPAK